MSIATFSIASTLLINIRTGEFGYVTHEFEDYDFIDTCGYLNCGSYNNLQLDKCYLFDKLTYRPSNGYTNYVDHHKYSLRPMKVIHTDINGIKNEIIRF